MASLSLEYKSGCGERSLTSEGVIGVGLKGRLTGFCDERGGITRSGSLGDKVLRSGEPTLGL